MSATDIFAISLLVIAGLAFAGALAIVSDRARGSSRE